MSAPPKAPQVRRVGHELLDPVVAPLGFRAANGVRQGWVGQFGDVTTSFDLVFSPWNHGGSPDPFEFTIDFLLTRHGPIGGDRLFHLLSQEQREEHRQIQNLVIAKIPVDEDALSGLSPGWQADRLVQVARRFAPYPPNDDVWFQYLDETDVRRWMAFIGRVLPSALAVLADAIKAG